jgi:hypothetical protein
MNGCLPARSGTPTLDVTTSDFRPGAGSLPFWLLRLFPVAGMFTCIGNKKPLEVTVFYVDTHFIKIPALRLRITV